MVDNFHLLTNPLCIFLDKEREDFTREDLLKVIKEKQIERITFHYTALDGKLKELKIPISSRFDAEIVLTEGERADGSSLFKGLIDTALSDLYIVPVYKSAFLNPFNHGSLDFVCRYITVDGKLADFTPDNILLKAQQLLKKNSDLDLYALGELEFYLFYNPEYDMYITEPQSGYHNSAPFSKVGRILAEMVRLIAQITGSVKYAHCEVGFINKIKSPLQELNGKTGEQLEIEFLPTPIDESADNIVIAKWLIRNIAYRNGMLATFAPKLEESSAGNGLHIHLRLCKNKQNVLVNDSGQLSKEAHKLIGGLCKYASSLPAFGNTVAASYRRLVPNQEAPTKICWSDSNRSAMIRVPLGWTKVKNLATIINPDKITEFHKIPKMQTIEFRTADGSANTHLLLAGLAMAIEWGVSNEESLQLADKLYVKGNIAKNRTLWNSLESLPENCYHSAKILSQVRELYQRENIFPESIIEYQMNLLRNENDRYLFNRLSKLKGKEREAFLLKIMHRDIHRH
ncbi:MAG: glutamine synthetase beta-grasp domain-containing protein [Ignavibacteria bacterium]